MPRKFITLMLVFALSLSAAASEPRAVYAVCAERAQMYLEYIGTHFAERGCTPDGEPIRATNRHDAARDWIIDTLADSLGADANIVCAPMSVVTAYGEAYTLHNIELTIEGLNPEKQIIVGAHYDGIGVGDNASGVALLIAVIEALKDETVPCTLKFVFFDGEETGLLGSLSYANTMSDTQIANTMFMVNVDAIAFGDYACIYGGAQSEDTGEITQTEAYELAVARARALGITVFTTSELDGSFANGAPPPIENALYTNPWTAQNPAPENACALSPTTGDWSDHAHFKQLGIPYLYMEATNWYAAGDGGAGAYTGYFEAADASLGYAGMFMNTEYDTLENLNAHFPERALKHYQIYAPLLIQILLYPEI